MTTVVAPAFSEARLSRTARVAIALAIVLGAGTFAVHVASSTPAPPSLSMWLGRQIITTHAVPLVLGPETFSSSGAASSPYGWLGDGILYLANAAGGTEALAILTFATLWAALVALYARCKARGLAVPFTVVVLGVAVLATRGTPLSISGNLNWLFLGALLLALESRDRRWSLAGIPLTAVWCNIAPAGLLAPMATLLCAIGTIVDERGFSVASRYVALAAAGAAIASLATPWGPGFERHALGVMGLDPALREFSAWQPYNASGGAYAFGFIALAIAACVSSVGRRLRPPDVLIALGAALLTLWDVAYLPAFAVAAGPGIARAIQASCEGRGWCVARRFERDVLVATAAIGIIASAGVASAAPPAARPSSMILTQLVAERHDHRVFCPDIADCDVVIASGLPGLAVFMDGRAWAYPKRVRSDQNAMSELHPAWRHRLTAWRIDTVVVRRGHALGAVLALLPQQWHVAARDEAFDLYERGAR